MLKEKLIEYLEANDIKFEDTGSKIKHSCISPLHNDSNPSAYTDLEKEYTYCSSCNYYLNTKQLYDFLGEGFDEALHYIYAAQRLLEEEDKEVEHSEVLLPKKWKDFNTKYRGISPELFSKLGVYITSNENFYHHRIIIPMYDVYGNLKSFEAVSVNGGSPKILRPKGKTDTYFGLENTIESDTVFITEGIFNALSFKECGYDGLCNFSTGSVSKKIGGLIKKGVRKVYLAGDPDSINPKTGISAGREFNKRMFYELRNTFQVEYFNYPYLDKDANDLHKLGKLKQVIERNLM